MTQGVLLTYVPTLFPKYFTLGKKAPCNALSLELYALFVFVFKTTSLPNTPLNFSSLQEQFSIFDI